jgi:hypothetical protein
MSVAEKIGRASLGRLSWAEICTLHPNEWVYLRDVEDAIDGSIGSARVITHDQSMRQMLAQLGEQPNTDTVVVHTWGRPLRSPRIEMTDEIRDIVPARR